MSNIKVIKPSFEIIEPTTNPVKKVARMTRICYRSEAAASDEADAKLISNCIKRTHRSVLEHGFVSAIFSGAPIDPKLLEPFGANLTDKAIKITSDYIWNNFDCPDRRKYMEVYGDNEIYKYIDGANSTQKTYDVYAANFHTWLRILDDFLSASIQKKYLLGAVFMMALISRMRQTFPEVFGGLYDNINEALANIKPDSAFYKICFGEKEKDGTARVVSIQAFEKFFKLFDMVVAPSCGKMTLSVIMRTDRAVTHELVRHRRGVAYSQESQRYVNYQNKGYEVVWPQMDPVKYKNAEFASVPVIENGSTESVVKKLHLSEDGCIPEGSSAYNTWAAAMELAVNHYEMMRSTEIIIPSAEEGKDDSVITIPPEVSRTVLPNSFATTIGVTWTPHTFTNLMYRRLASDAQYPIRSLLSKVLIDGLKNKHPFFENFPPALIRRWIDLVQKSGILTDGDLATSLIDYQNKRQENIEKHIREAIEKAKAKFEADEKARKERMEKQKSAAAKPSEENK
jgi:thymidylate synthase ThyX